MISALLTGLAVLMFFAVLTAWFAMIDWITSYMQWHSGISFFLSLGVPVAIVVFFAVLI